MENELDESRSYPNNHSSQNPAAAHLTGNVSANLARKCIRYLLLQHPTIFQSNLILSSADQNASAFPRSPLNGIGLSLSILRVHALTHNKNSSQNESTFPAIMG